MKGLNFKVPTYAEGTHLSFSLNLPHLCEAGYK